MWTILWVFIAIAVGFMMYAGIQDEIPESLALLKNNGTTAASTVKPIATYKGWQVNKDEKTGAVEIIKAFTTSAPQIGVASLNGPPIVGILCQSGISDLRLNLAAPIKSTTVELNGKAIELEKGSQFNLFPKEKGEMLQIIRNTPQISIKVMYDSLGSYDLSLNTEGINELITQLPKGCQ